MEKEKEYLLSRCIPEPNSGCWLWLGAVSNGYGVTYIDYVAERAHRLSYRVFKGPILGKNLARHLCHNTYCINPDHIEQGNYKDNAQDRVKMIRAKRRLKDKAYEWWLP